MKKFILITVLIFISIGLSGQLSLINVGAAANDHTGDALRTAFQKTNSAITQVNTNTANILLKANLASPTFTGVVTIPAGFHIGATTILTSADEFNYLVNVTSNIQTQLNGKAATSHSQAQSTITNLSDSLLARYTKTQSNSRYATSSHNQAQSTITNLSDSLLARYTKTQANSRYNAKLNISDTAGMLTKYLLKTDTVHVQDKLNAKLDTANTLNLGDVAPLLVDTAYSYTFGAGANQAADSILFAQNMRYFGTINWKKDTLYAVNFDNVTMSAGDSTKFNVYIGNGMTHTATDSMFTAPQALGHHQTSVTPNKTRKVAPGSAIWPGISGVPPVGKRPKEWILQLNYYIIPGAR